MNNIFEELNIVQTTEQSKTKKLAYTDTLQAEAKKTAMTVIQKTSGNEQAKELAKTALEQKSYESAICWVDAVVGLSSLNTAVLDGCPKTDLDKMLECQRSNRSKTKAKSAAGFDMPRLVAYMSAVVGEYIIRQNSGKSYKPTTASMTDFDAAALTGDALKKKIACLSSKASRLRPLAKYDEAAATELAEVEAKLAELRQNRPTTAKAVVKSVTVENLREQLANMTDAERKAFLDKVLAAAD